MATQGVVPHRVLLHWGDDELGDALGGQQLRGIVQHQWGQRITGEPHDARKHHLVG